MKNPLTPAGIEPATFRFVAQNLNHRATAIARQYTVLNLNPISVIRDCFDGVATRPRARQLRKRSWILDEG